MAGRQQEITATGDRAHVRVEVLGTLKNGRTGLPRGASGRILSPGQTLRLYASAESDARLCEAAFSLDPPDGEMAHRWQIDATLMAATPTTSTVKLRWARWKPTEGEKPAELGEANTVTLRPGEFRAFDFLEAAASPSCSNIVMRVLADPVPEQVEQVPMVVDLWAVQEGAGRRRWVRGQVSGGPTEVIPFNLETLRWAIDGTPRNDAADPLSVGIEVTGTLQLTPRPEGFVDVSVRVMRNISVDGLRARGDGESTFRCAYGEAVEMLVPAPKGQIRTDLKNAGALSLAPGVLTDDQGNIGVDFARFFAGSRTALYIVVRKMQ